jgi:hypothetical protein
MIDSWRHHQRQTVPEKKIVAEAACGRGKTIPKMLKYFVIQYH